jgi:8-oxo-dGTP diphosphatase
MIKTAGAIIIKEDKFLMQYRDDKAPNYPNTWSIFGGCIEKEETPSQALVRELKEELGISIKESEINCIGEYNIPNELLTLFTYNLKEPLSSLRLMEGGGMCLFSIEEIKENKKVLPHVRETILSLKCK